MTKAKKKKGEVHEYVDLYEELERLSRKIDRYNERYEQIISNNWVPLKTVKDLYSLFQRDSQKTQDRYVSIIQSELKSLESITKGINKLFLPSVITAKEQGLSPKRPKKPAKHTVVPHTSPAGELPHAPTIEPTIVPPAREPALSLVPSTQPSAPSPAQVVPRQQGVTRERVSELGRYITRMERYGSLIEYTGASALNVPTGYITKRSRLQKAYDYILSDLFGFDVSSDLRKQINYARNDLEEILFNYTPDELAVAIDTRFGCETTNNKLPIAVAYLLKHGGFKMVGNYVKLDEANPLVKSGRYFNGQMLKYLELAYFPEVVKYFVTEQETQATS